MTKHERINSVLKHQKVDRAPAAFWLHFSQEDKFGQRAVDAHIKLMNDSDTDLIKIMNENIFWDGSTRIDCLSDIKSFRGFSRKDSVFQAQMELIRSIAEQNNGEAPMVATIHGLIASAFHEIGRPKLYSSLGYLFPIFCRERPTEMKAVFEQIAQSLIELVDCSLQAGADGIFYAVLGAERHFFEDNEFDEFVAPYENAIYQHIRRVSPLNILHICKANINLQRYSSLNPAIVNWSVHDNNLSLKEGHDKFFPNSVMLGGFNNHGGALLSGTVEDIKLEAKQLCNEMSDIPYIIGADCSLPTNIQRERIKVVVNALNDKKGI